MKRYKRYEDKKSIEDLFNKTEFIANFYINALPEDEEKLRKINCVFDVENSPLPNSNLIIKTKCKGYDTIMFASKQITKVVGKDNIIKIEMINPKF